jgi:hypothetical protein
LLVVEESRDSGPLKARKYGHAVADHMAQLDVVHDLQIIPPRARDDLF